MFLEKSRRSSKLVFVNPFDESLAHRALLKDQFIVIKRDKVSSKGSIECFGASDSPLPWTEGDSHRIVA